MELYHDIKAVPPRANFGYNVFTLNNDKCLLSLNELKMMLSRLQGVNAEEHSSVNTDPPISMF